MRRSFTVPAGLDFKELIYEAGTITVKRRRKHRGKQTVSEIPEDAQDYYDDIFKNHIQKAYFMLDRIIEVGVKQRDEMINGFTQLQLDLLYKVVAKPTLNQIIDVMKALGIIEVRHWRHDSKNPENSYCKGYKLTPEYANRDIVFIEVEKKLGTKIEKNYNEKTNHLLKSVHHPEHKWQKAIFIDGDYSIDTDNAYRLAEKFLKDGKALDDEEGEVFNWDRFKAMKMQIKKLLEDGDPDYTISPKCDKVFTSFNNASAYLRPFIKDSNGRSLMQLDFTTSHGMHLIKHLEEEIKKGYLYISIKGGRGEYPYTDTPAFKDVNIDKLAQDLSFLKDKALNYEPDLYRYLADRYEEDHGYRLNTNSKKERAEIKDIWNKSFLCGGFKNKTKVRWMKSVFPEISKYIEAYGPKKFSTALQTSESKLLNNIIIRRICKETPKCLLFGLFDGIVVEEDHADEVYSIMLEESEKYFGFAVGIKPCDYDTELQRCLEYLDHSGSNELVPVLTTSLEQEP